MAFKIKFVSSEKYLVIFPVVPISLLILISEENCVFLPLAKIQHMPNNIIQILGRFNIISMTIKL